MSETEFLSIISSNQGIIHKICRLYRDGDEDQEDLFQEIVFQLWKAFPNYRGEAKVSTWLYRIALNTALISFRKRRPPLDFVAKVPDLQENNPQEDESRHLMLVRALRMIKESERALVMLYLEDLSYQQIAEIIGITENNVGVKLNRIKEKLKKLLNGTR